MHPVTTESRTQKSDVVLAKLPIGKSGANGSRYPKRILSRTDRSATYGLIMAQAAVPHHPRNQPGEKKPAGLDREGLPEFGAFQSFEKNRDRTKQFVIKRHPFQRRLNSRRHDIDRKHLPAEEIFE